MSEVPPMTDFLRPILRWASKRSSGFYLSEIAEAMANHFNLSPEAREERTEGDNEYCFYKKMRLAINPHLKEARLVRSTHHGHYEITQAGRDEAFASNERMTPAYLRINFLPTGVGKTRTNNKSVVLLVYPIVLRIQFRLNTTDSRRPSDTIRAGQGLSAWEITEATPRRHTH